MQIRIAQVCIRHYPYPGGVEAHVRMVSERLAKQGMEVEVLTTDPSGKLPKKELIGGVNIRRFNCWAPSGAFYFSPSLRRYLRKYSSHYDVIHAHNYHGFPALYALLTKGNNILALTPHYHGTSYSKIRRLLHIPYRFLWAQLLGKVDKIICVSEAEKLLFQTNFRVPDEKFVIIPNGIEVEAIQAAQYYDTDNKVILYVGRLEKYKNIHHIIKAMPYMSGEYSLCIVGDGTYKTKLAQLIAQLGLEKQVKILSGLSNEEVYRWYKTCSAFVTLSGLEAFGITVIEGIAAGKPVVASDIPAIRELANKLHGIQLVKIPSTTPQELAEVITKSAESSPRQSNLADFSWKNIAAKISSAYKELL